MPKDLKDLFAALERRGRPGGLAEQDVECADVIPEDGARLAILLGALGDTQTLTRECQGFGVVPLVAFMRGQVQQRYELHGRMPQLRAEFERFPVVGLGGREPEHRRRHDPMVAERLRQRLLVAEPAAQGQGTFSRLVGPLEAP